ncbi:hypothetical protein LTR72_009493, partial [Exophiala xenobiotica]
MLDVTDDLAPEDNAMLDSAFSGLNLQMPIDPFILQDTSCMPPDFDFAMAANFSFDPAHLLPLAEPFEFSTLDLLAPPQLPPPEDERFMTNPVHVPHVIHPPIGFALAQNDPVEAKCLEIKNILGDSELFVSKSAIDDSITRSNLVQCINLFDTHFQPNVPILHLPTFSLTDASPLSLLAMTLAGACYSDDTIPISTVSKLAMRLLMLIENQP